ncbi:hypothetical protein BKA69DRAFT_1122783 [Paraphysoderma sedebokerense]|nr:hypothetical protein BKA69DRAFT_1122783 [Paraphysoderma sedebokerense]
MATICPLLSLQKVAMASIFAGMTINCFMNIVTSTDLYGFKKNRILFATIVTGLISCVGFGIASATIQMSTLGSVSYQIAGWFWMLSAFCLYSVLFERALALRNRIAVSKATLLVVRYLGPILFTIPQMLYIVFLSDPFKYYQALNVCTTLGTIMYIVANLVLSVSFVYTLAAHREESILNFIRNRPGESGTLILNAFVTLVFVICRLIGIGMPLVSQPTLFITLQNTMGNFVAITMFKDYIFVTRQVSKEILASKLTPQSGGSHNSKNQNPASSRVTAAS